MKRWAAILLAVIWAAAAQAAERPTVVSLDSCSDQLVLALADDSQILALSRDSTGPFSFYRERALKFPQHQGNPEEILLLRPDVVLSTGAGDPGLVELLEGLGISVIKTGLPGTIDEAVEDLRTAGKALGQEITASRLAETARIKLAHLRAGEGVRLRAVYISPSGITTGGGTFLDQVMALAGLENLLAETGTKGWSSFDVETFIALKPDVLITSFFNSKVGFSEGWRFSEHPAVEAAMAGVRVIDVPAKYLSCPAWFAAEGAELIREKIKETNEAPGA